MLIRLQPIRNIRYIITIGVVKDFWILYADRVQSVYTVATLDVDLTGVPRHSFRRRKSPTGGFYYSLRFQVEISVHSSLEYSLLVDGVRYGSVVAKYA
jgi:hypothetical protein